MRKSTQDFGWMVSAGGVLQGISLGHDSCAEHESSILGIRSAFSVPNDEYPLGIESRQIKVTPKKLSYHEHKVTGKNRRKQPAALLIYDALAHPDEPQTAVSAVADYGMRFTTEQDSKWYKAERDDVVIVWDTRSFAIHVRGSENILHLKELFTSFQALDIAVASPSQIGFRRSGVSFVIPSSLTEAERAAIVSQDVVNNALRAAVAASGIESRLKTAGKGWYALSPDWVNRDKQEELIFCLNPREQSKYNGGWFSVSDLEQWAENKGPVLKDTKLDEFSKSNEGWQSKVLRHLKEKSLYIRHQARLEWMDAEQTKVGIRIRPAVGSEDRLPEGLYEFYEFFAKSALAG